MIFAYIVLILVFIDVFLLCYNKEIDDICIRILLINLLMTIYLIFGFNYNLTEEIIIIFSSFLLTISVCFFIVNRFKLTNLFSRWHLLSRVAPSGRTDRLAIRGLALVSFCIHLWCNLDLITRGREWACCVAPMS